MNSQCRNMAIGSPFISSPTTIQSLTLMGLSSFLPPKRFSPLSPLISRQWNPRSSGQSGSLLPGSYPGTHRRRYGRYSHCWLLSLQSSSCPPVFLISCYVVRFVLVAMRCNPFRTIVNTPRNNKKINIIIPIASGKILIALINAAGVKTSIQPIIFLSFIYSPSYFFMPMRIAQSFISTTVVIGASPIYWLICSTVSLMHFPHIGQ